MNWKIGQKLVCIDSRKTNPLLYHLPHPFVGEIVTFDGLSEHGRSIYLKEYNHFAITDRVAFWKYKFIPLIGQSAKSELIEKFVEVEEKSDCPIQVPETV